MFTGNHQGMSISAADYKAVLAVASSNYDGNDAQRYLHDYYREFYDYDLEQFYYVEGQVLKQTQSNSGEAMSEGSPIMMNETAINFEGDTVGTTVTYLSNLSVEQILDSIPNLQVDGLVIEILFTEQDVPQMWAEWKLPR